MGDTKIKKISEFLQKSGKFQRIQLNPATEAMATKTKTEIEEWISTDDKNVSEVIVTGTGDFVSAVIRFPLSQRLGKQDVSAHATELLKLSSSINANLGLVADRLTLSYNSSARVSEADKCVTMVESSLRNGALAATRLRDLIGTNMKLNTNVGQDALYQSKLGKPVKLDAADLALAQGGDVGTVLASVASLVLGLVALTLVGAPVAGGGSLAIGGAELAVDATDTIIGAIPNYSPPPPRNPPKRSYCFSADTLVSTPRGMRRIDGINVGDLVWSNGADGSRVQSKVTERQVHDVDASMVVVTLANGEEMKASDGHPVLTTKGWLNVEDLSKASELVGLTGNARVVSVRRDDVVGVQIFNLVTDSGSYLVGSSEVVASGVTNVVAKSQTA